MRGIGLRSAARGGRRARYEKGRRWRGLAGVACSAWLALGASPASVAADDETEWATRETIEAFVADRFAQMRMPGLAVVAIVEGEVRYEGAFGDAVPDGTAMSLDTPVSLGSTSKQFTGLAIQQLIAQSRVALGSTVAEVLPDVGPTPYDDVTVAQLLSHHSGISFATGLVQWRIGQDATTVSELARLTLSTQPSSEPGSRYEYSNGNYTVLGAMVEELTDETYSAALQELVVDPLGLTSTTADLAAAQADGLATWNYPWYGIFTSPTAQPASPGSAPSAFVNATARDLERLLLAHLGSVDTQVPADVLSAARAPLAEEFEYSDYASGWSVRPFWELRDLDAGWDDGTLPSLWEHQGTTLRSFSYLAMQPELGFGVAIVANTGIGLNQGQVYALAYGLSHTIAGTDAHPIVPSPLIAAAPVLIVALPLLLAAIAVWLVRTLRHPPRTRLRRALPFGLGVVVVAAVLYLCFGVIPTETGVGLFDPSWWPGAPDLAISTALMLLLSGIAGVLAMAVLVAGARARPAPGVVSSGTGR